jgi:hypothetical protein
METLELLSHLACQSQNQVSSNDRKLNINHICI